MNNPILETKDQRIVYGETIERFICNKINSLNSSLYWANTIDRVKGYKRSPKNNHNEGDIYIKKNGKLIRADIKRTTINLEDDNKKFDTISFFEDVDHQYFIGVKGFNGNENDLNQNVYYMLLETSVFKNKIKDNDFMKKYRLPKETRVGQPDYIYINSFSGYAGYFSSNDIEKILEKII